MTDSSFFLKKHEQELLIIHLYVVTRMFSALPTWILVMNSRREIFVNNYTVSISPPFFNHKAARSIGKLMIIQSSRLVTYLFSSHHFDRDGLRLIMTFSLIIPSRQNNDDRHFTHGKSFLVISMSRVTFC
jgi:hypothetical protein